MDCKKCGKHTLTERDSLMCEECENQAFYGLEQPSEPMGGVY